MKWGTTDSEFNGTGAWATPASDAITLSDVPTATTELYVQVVLTGGSAAGTYKSGKVTVSFEGESATVSETVDFTKQDDAAKTGTVTIPFAQIGSTLKTAAATGTATVKWGTDGESFEGEGTWETPASGDIKLNDVPTATKELYVQVALTGSSADGTYKSAKVTIDFASGTEVSVSSEVAFTKEDAQPANGTVTIPFAQIGSTLTEAASGATATVSWGTDGSAFAGSGTWTNVASDPITLSEVPTSTGSIYVQVVLAGGSAEGTYKSDAITLDFKGSNTATVESEVAFTKQN